LYARITEDRGLYLTAGYKNVVSLLFSLPSQDCLSNQSQSQSHIATDGQSVSKSWCQAPFVAHDLIFITV
jgi:hypothetical protein